MIFTEVIICGGHIDDVLVWVQTLADGGGVGGLGEHWVVVIDVHHIYPHGCSGSQGPWVSAMVCHSDLKIIQRPGKKKRKLILI